MLHFKQQKKEQKTSNFKLFFFFFLKNNKKMSLRREKLDSVLEKAINNAIDSCSLADFATCFGKEIAKKNKELITDVYSQIKNMLK